MSTHNLVWIEITPEVSESPKRVFLKTPGRNRWIIHIQRLTFNDSNVIVKSILVKNNLFFFFCPGFYLLVFLPSSVLSLLFLPYQFSQFTQSFDKANRDSKKSCPLEGWNILLKIQLWVVLFGSFHSTFRQHLQSQHFRPKKNTLIVMTLNHFFVLHCHLSLRLPTFKTVSLRVNRRSVHGIEQKAGSTGWAQAHEKVTSVHWLTAAVVCKSPKTSGLGDGQRWDTGSWHTDIPVSGDPPQGCGLQGWGVVGEGPPRHMSAQQAGSMSCSCEQRPVAFIHPETKGITWSQNIFGLYKLSWLHSTFLSWNLKPKALSC